METYKFLTLSTRIGNGNVIYSTGADARDIDARTHKQRASASR